MKEVGLGFNIDKLKNALAEIIEICENENIRSDIKLNIIEAIARIAKHDTRTNWDA